MARKYIVILALLVIVPILAFLVLGRRLVEADQVRTRQQFKSLLDAVLTGVDTTIADYFETLQQRLLAADIDPYDVDSIRAFARKEPLVEQIVLLDAEGLPVFPEPSDPYFTKIRQLILDRTFVHQNLREQGSLPVTNTFTQPITQIEPLGQQSVKVIIHPTPTQSSSNQSFAPNPGHATNATPKQDYGWYGWYWGNGLQLIHWQALDDNRTLVIGLKRARWMADIIGILPESDPTPENSAAPAQIRLIDADGDVVYLWGANTELPKDAVAETQLHLSAPLRPWQVQHFGPSKPFAFNESATLVNLIGAGGLLFAGLLGLVIFLSREIGRQTRDARQRVSFVNQVSHELKTPLTNIRMYAELLENDLERIDPDDEKAKAHVAVITGESGRLSRLINNVLTLARTSRDAPPARIQTGSVDAVIATVVEQFQPSLDQLAIEVTLDLDAQEPVSLDVDAVEQMLGNLISNVEKYAADGKHLRIASRFKDGTTTVDVSDAGPGITPAFAKRVFEPFERESDQIVSATGTGIGLGITRSLARRHGGDLVMRESAIGASFRLTLATPIWEG